MPNGRQVGSCGRLFISANMGTNRQPMCAAARGARMRREREPLQNRVTPFGDVVAIPQRGLYIGNRAIIHDPANQNAPWQALDDQGVARLRPRLQGASPGVDGRPQLDRALLSR
jgi:hypothetical protein